MLWVLDGLLLGWAGSDSDAAVLILDLLDSTDDAIMESGSLVDCWPS